MSEQEGPRSAPGDDELDPQLLELFARVEAPPTDQEAFAEQVMRRVHRHQRWLLVARVAAALVLAVLAIPLQDPLELMTDALLAPLFEAQGGFGREMLSPLSSIGAVLTVCLLGLQLLFRRLLR